nr:hypothetical protein [Bacillus subtilis]
MADMYILSPDDQVLTVLSSDGQEACRFWDAKYKEELNKGSSQLVEKTTFFLQAFLFYTVSLDIHQVSDAEKALPHA